MAAIGVALKAIQSTDPVQAATIALAAATVGLAIATFWQARATARGLELQRDQARILNEQHLLLWAGARPFLEASLATPIPVGVDRLQGRITYMGGSLPATDVTVWVSHMGAHYSGSIRPLFPSDHEIEFTLTLGPDAVPPVQPPGEYRGGDYWIAVSYKLPNGAWAIRQREYLRGQWREKR
ncbi:MAG: hypothetical protein E6J41_10560 [Chloroflexi bacterium]|nr:MAG: hypothetical protein E6J41_10560 [Chloroflexota bacterium]